MSTRPSTPTSWFEPLTNILNMEEKRGFNNTSVAGGVDKFIHHWAESITRDLGDSEASRALLETPYIDLTREERPRWVEQWRTLIARQQDAAQSPLDVSDNAQSPVSLEIPPAPSSQEKPRAADRQPPGGLPDAPSGNRTGSASPSQAASVYRKPPGGLTVDTQVDRLRGVDDKQAERLKRLDVHTVRDLLYLFPRRHLDYSNVVKVSELVPGEMCTVVGTVWEARNLKGGPSGKRTDTEAVISDDTGNIRIRWFGQRYLAQTLKPNRRVAISGKVDVYRGQINLRFPRL